MRDREEWKIIPEFPDYSISSLGRVWNNYRNREVVVNYTNWGHVKVCFTRARLTRSVALLVAEAFIQPLDRQSNNVVILDGNLKNVAAFNLTWRPRHFAQSYARQFPVTQLPLHFRNLAVVNLDLRVEYDCIVRAGIAEGVLFNDIWESTYLGRRPYPFHYRYKISERV